MNITNTESVQFIDSLKAVGIEISNESELRERLSEAVSWKYALQTLIENGKLLGIKFIQAQKVNMKKLHKVFEKFSISLKTEKSLLQNLQSV